MLGEEYAIKGTSRFLSNVPTTSPFLTKYGEITEEEARSFMKPYSPRTLILKMTLELHGLPLAWQSTICIIAMPRRRVLEDASYKLLVWLGCLTNIKKKLLRCL